MNQQNKEHKHQLVVIGAGPGGYAAAFMAAGLGIEVTMIDPEANPGGVCLYRGCIPTKALLYAVKLKQQAMQASSMGIRFKEPEVDIERLSGWKDKVVKKLTGGLGQLAKHHKINYLQGYASFSDSVTLDFQDPEGNREKIRFEHAIIATGVKPRELPGIETDGNEIMGSSSALELRDVPGKLLIVGGGYIGLELAAIYNELGSKVSICELTDGFMPGMDRDLVGEFEKSNNDLFQDVYLETSLKKAGGEGNGLKVKMEDKKGEEINKQFEKIIVAIGLKPDHTGLGLDNTGVETDQDGYIKVDRQQRTAQQHILAVGDATGEPLLAHKATYEGRIAAEVIAGNDSVYDARVIPAVIYTEPEMAVCGLTENGAREKDIRYELVKFPWSASGRAAAMNESRGFTKLLVQPENGRILGAGIVGKDAGDLIPELALAIEMSATAEDLAWTVHPHPTLSETIMEAAEIFLGYPAHTISKKQKKG